MLNQKDILQTQDMIDKRHLDIRTITMGISLLDCADRDIDACARKIYDKICFRAERLVKTGEDIEWEFGIPIVNKRISVTLCTSVFNAVKLANDGVSAKEIAEISENEAAEQSIYVSVNTLEYLKKSGRVTTAGAAIGTLLGINPVLQIQGGKLDAYKKVRGMKAATDAMLDGIENDRNTRFAGKKIQIRAAYSGDLKAGKEWQAQVAKRFPDLEIELDALPLSISCHVGGGALGIGISTII
mgnify:CR=1 FL=1